MKKLLFIIMLIVLCSFTFATPTPHDYNAYYKCDGATGTTLLDQTGTYTMPTSGSVNSDVNGINGSSARGGNFATNTIFFKDTTHLTYLYTKNKTIDFYLKVPSATTGCILGSDGTGDNFDMRSCYYSNGNISWDLYGTSSSTFQLNGVNDINKWYHITLTYNASNKEHCIWINGTKACKDGTSLGTSTSSTIFRVGDVESTGSGGLALTGSIDEMKIWDRVLTDAEINGTIIPPTVLETTLVYPLNTTHYNDYSGFINVTSNINSTCAINNSNWTRILDNLNHIFQNNTEIGYGNHSINMVCDNLADGSFTNYGATYSYLGCKYGGCYEFDEADTEFIDIPENFVDKEATYSFWLEMDKIITDDRFVFSTGKYGSECGIHFYLGGGVKPRVRWQNYSSALGTSSPSFDLNESQNYFFTITKNETFLQLWMDGYKVKNLTMNNGCDSSIFEHTVLGANSGYSRYFNGTIDEVRTWNIELSQAEIQAEMASSSPVIDNASLLFSLNDDINTSFWFIVDTVPPTANVSFINNSIQANPFTTIIEFYDEYIYRANTTVYLESNKSKILFQNFSGDLPYETYLYNTSFYANLTNSTYIIGDYVVFNLSVTDTHTASKFNERPKTIKLDMPTSKFKQYDLNHGKFTIEYPKDMEVEEDYTFDRMHFKLKSKKLKNKDTYQYVEADKIVYYENSEYPCHMIVNDKYWYDCVGMKDPKVSKVMNNKYKIDFFMDFDEVITKSLGGLNELNTSYRFKVNKNFTGLIEKGDFFNPPDTDFNYTSQYNFTASSLVVNESCIRITGANVSTYDGSYCYHIDFLDLENKVIFAETTPLECYINISNSTGDIITVDYQWLNKTTEIIASGLNACDSGNNCTLSELSGSLTTTNNSYTCNASLTDSWFSYWQESDFKNTSTIGVCDAVNIYPVINITYRDETSEASINVTASYDIAFSDGTSVFPVQANNTGSYTAFCTDVNPATQTFDLTMYGDIILSSDGYVSRVFSIPESLGTEISNSPYVNDTYYLIQIGNSTTITYTWQTDNFQYIDGVMQIYRCEPDGSRTLIESTTVAGGIATANLQLYTTAYSYSITIDGVTYTEDSYYACHVESSTTKSYYVDTSEIDILPVIGLFMIDCTLEKLNPTTVKLTWAENSQDPDPVEACILGFRENIYNYTQIYESCTNGTSGSMTRVLGLTGNNYKITGEIHQNGFTGYCRDEIYFMQRGDTSTELGATGALSVALLILSCIFLFAAKGELQILGASLGLIISWLLGVTSIGWFYITFMLAFGVIIVVIGRYTKK